jgi:hypothetical protein
MQFNQLFERKTKEKIRRRHGKGYYYESSADAYQLSSYENRVH